MSNKQILIIETTNICNSRCKHCLRENAMHGKFTYKFDEMLTALKEIKEFSLNFENFELKISGGEPTIWKDGDKNIIDILSECQKLNFNYSLVTNGKLFSKFDYCEKFFKTLSERGVSLLNIFCTIDNFHENYFYDCPILDNLLKIEDVKINLTVQSTCSVAKDYNISSEFIKKYFDKGIKFIMNPLLPWGKGVECEKDVPKVNLNSNNKDQLGDYKKYFYILGKSQNLWNTFEEFENFNNFEALKKLNHCGKTITLDEGKYFYCMPRSSEKEFCFATLGNLNYDNYLEFVKNHSVINKSKNNNFDIENLDINSPFGYGVCDICRKFNKE